ncbi:hypothetical protein [Natronolimnobius baerhuensis]|uniref:DUF7964 domain-containing protein n=1 Tax=Natronolimnobius baerhuensis TaxID=253108 RepID=A0A202E5E7_9EURY|nr:hypothetical protein [Natronolimnobius baerhuensis]OVE83471.1 hypothetical protein B2G88_13580 [Natronolimnobius baerhuensis]
MGLFDSLPAEPLSRAQIGRLEQMDAVGGTHAIYSQSEPDAAYGLVILLNGSLRAWAYFDEQKEWDEINATPLETSEDGEFDDHDLVEVFHDEILAELGATKV